MPGNPFSNAVTLDELWKNILFDQGISVSTAPTPLEMKTILRDLDYGLFGAGLGTYGDGSDGTLNFIATGSTTVAGATLSAGVYTMTRDIWAGNGTIIQSGVTINTAGFRLFCNGLLTNNGTIQNNGNAASGATQGSGLSQTATAGWTSSAGGAGATTGAGANGSAVATNGYGGVGGTGGTAGANAGGSGGTITASTAAVQQPRSTPLSVFARVLASGTAFALPGAGSGGGAGGADGTNSSGGGGGGGGCVAVVAQTINGTGTIQANGGAGGAASATGNSAGGGGGGGGVVLVTSRSVIPVAVSGASTASIPGQTIQALGGAGGAGNGTGTAGSAGSVGTLILVPA